MKPSLPKGTRDFNPEEMLRRNHILNTITGVYRRYGYQQIETPAMENLSTLTGKYGDEGDQLLFRILNSRLHESKKKDQVLEEFQRSLEQNINSDILTERALRYDLTVPFARYVVMHQHEITFPFRRFQVQPVWRADRPQKGRYREFYQCDADVIGSDSLLNEAELVFIISEVFRSLNIPVTIKLNNRKVLTGISEKCGMPEKIIDITVAIDKLDKIGESKVIEELSAKGINDTSIEKIKPFFGFSGSNQDKINFLKTELKDSATGTQGVTELETIIGLCKNEQLELDITLARGLNYYTGAIFEVKANDVEIGSVCGGGRYDDLTGVFGLKGLSGVGISFGIDRIYDVMLESGLFSDQLLSHSYTQLMFVNFGDKESQYCLDIAQQLRTKGIAVELYPENAKMKKQMAYADANKIKYVALIGDSEMSSDTVTVKNMQSGEQKTIPVNQIAHLITQG